MLSRLWLLFLAAAIALGVWFRQPPLLLGASLALLVSGSIVLWHRWSMIGVSFERRLSAHRAEFGDFVPLTLEIVNLKPLPLTTLQVDDQVPGRLPILGGVVRPQESHGYPRHLYVVLAVLPYERVTRRLRVACTHRGEHAFGPALLRSGDYLGLLPSYLWAPRVDRLVVFPKVFPLTVGPLAANQFLGRLTARRLYLTDPIRVVGAREYVSGDPYRMVDWRASARRGKLMVRILEPSTTPVLDIVVNLKKEITLPGSPDYDDMLEFAISIVASLAAHAAGLKWAVGLRANGESGGVPIALSPSTAPGHIGDIIETLARTEGRPTGRISELLLRHESRAPTGAVLVLVTTLLDADCVAAAFDLRRRGHPLLVVHVTNADAEEGPDHGLPIVRMRYDERWSEKESLVLGD